MPVMPGRPMSERTTSGSWRGIFSSASSMLRKAPVHAYPSVPLTSSARHSRISRSSSMMATLMGSPTSCLAVPTLRLLVPPRHRIFMWGPRFDGFADRNREHEDGAVIRIRDDLQGAAQTLRPFPHAQKSMTVAVAAVRLEPPAVVADDQDEPVGPGAELEVRAGAVRVSHQVVDGFLEDEEQLAPHVGADAEILPRIRRAELELYPASREDVAREMPHAL